MPIDTNHLERALRAIPMGRKNWLFCWTELGAQQVGIMQSLIVTCRLHGIDPYDYLVACLEELFGQADQVKVLGENVILEGFDLADGKTVVAICRQGKRRARVTLDSLEFPALTPGQARWLKAWQQFSNRSP